MASVIAKYEYKTESNGRKMTNGSQFAVHNERPTELEVLKKLKSLHPGHKEIVLLDIKYIA